MKLKNDLLSWKLHDVYHVYLLTTGILITEASYDTSA